MKKILTIVGARPQFIKAATISRVIREQYADKIEEKIVHTGQHYDINMSDIFFEEMQIPKPHYRLSVGGKFHGEMTGEMLIELEKLMIKEQPDIVLVYGDTNSTLAGALAASKLHIPVAHVEAGLRSFNKKMPEEINRIMTDHVSSILFPPTEISKKQLAKETITKNVYTVGDVMYDAALFYKKISTTSEAIKKLPDEFYLVTCHRQENTDDKQNLIGIFDALKELSKELPVVLPLHPRTKKYLEEYNISTEEIILIEPVGYFDMLFLLEKAKMVLTDSGGLQKEAYYFEKPVVIMRDQTEWVELVENGIGKITGSNKIKILNAVKELLGVKKFPKNIYGDGRAAEKIVEKIFEIFA